MLKPQKCINKGKITLASPSLIIVADTNVLINFLNINRLDLIHKHSHTFAITDHVREEITECYGQQRLLKEAIDLGVLIEKNLVTAEELNLFAKFMHSGRLGAGESSAISCAAHGGHKLAIDDKRAISEAERIVPGICILKTQDIILSMITEKILTINEADDIKKIWEAEHKFQLKFESFAKLVTA